MTSSHSVLGSSFGSPPPIGKSTAANQNSPDNDLCFKGSPNRGRLPGKLAEQVALNSANGKNAQEISGHFSRRIDNTREWLR